MDLGLSRHYYKTLKGSWNEVQYAVGDGAVKPTDKKDFFKKWRGSVKNLCIARGGGGG